MLLIDDNLLFLLALESILVSGGNGWQAVKARNGLDALAKLDRQSYDLVVTDDRMPGMDSLELLEAVRHNVPEVPVIVMTGHDSRELRERAEDLGAFCVLEKPVPGPVFLRAVREGLGEG
jgi:CheY-like chemotaxis protein